MRLLVSYLAGLLFGVGLLISRMANPAKVLSFLDFAGRWDPSLALVMGAAVGIAGVGFGIGRHRAQPSLGGQFAKLPRSGIDPPLITGAAIFGVGWGLSGLCPGPALVDLPLRPIPIGLFIMAMLIGMALVRLIPAGRRHLPSAATDASPAD